MVIEDKTEDVLLMAPSSTNGENSAWFSVYKSKSVCRSWLNSLLVSFGQEGQEMHFEKQALW